MLPGTTHIGEGVREAKLGRGRSWRWCSWQQWVQNPYEDAVEMSQMEARGSSSFSIDLSLDESCPWGRGENLGWVRQLPSTEANSGEGLSCEPSHEPFTHSQHHCSWSWGKVNAYGQKGKLSGTPSTHDQWPCHLNWGRTSGAQTQEINWLWRENWRQGRDRVIREDRSDSESIKGFQRPLIQSHDPTWDSVQNQEKKSSLCCVEWPSSLEDEIYFLIVNQHQSSYDSEFFPPYQTVPFSLWHPPIPARQKDLLHFLFCKLLCNFFQLHTLSPATFPKLLLRFIAQEHQKTCLPSSTWQLFKCLQTLFLSFLNLLFSRPNILRTRQTLPALLYNSMILGDSLIVFLWHCFKHLVNHHVFISQVPDVTESLGCCFSGWKKC